MKHQLLIVFVSVLLGSLSHAEQSRGNIDTTGTFDPEIQRQADAREAKRKAEDIQIKLHLQEPTTGPAAGHSLNELLRPGVNGPVDAEMLWSRGIQLFNEKDFAGAKKYFERLILSFPQSPRAPAAKRHLADLSASVPSATAHGQFTVGQ